MTDQLITIALCDDQQPALCQLQNILNKIQSEFSESWRIRTYDSPVYLLEHINEIDIVFLDIEMPEMDGIDVGKLILTKNPDCRIIMASGREDRMKDGYHVHALRFVTKPFDKDEITEAMKAALCSFVGYETISLYNNRIIYEVRQRDIRYIRACNSYIEAYAGSLIYRQDLTLDEAERILNRQIFYRIHKSFIVNYLWIGGVRQYKVRIGEQTLPVSRRRYMDFLKHFSDFDRGR